MPTTTTNTHCLHFGKNTISLLTVGGAEAKALQWQAADEVIGLGGV